METKKKNSSFVNTLTKKKKILIGALGCLSVTSMLMGSACFFGNNDYTDHGENGVYYCIVDGKEYQVILSKGVATLVFDGETDSAAYQYDGESFSLTLQGEESPLNAKFSGNALTLEYNGSTYTYLKKVNYLVSYNVDGGSAVASEKVVNGKTLDQPESPVKEGYNFIAWYTDSEFTTPFVFGATIVTSDLTLYARYAEKVVGMGEYVVSFDTLGGNVIEDAKTVSGKLYNLPVAEKANETFLGWWMSDTQDPTQLTCQYTGQALSANTTLYAVYKSDAPAISVTEKGASWTSVGAGLNYKVTITDPNGGTTTSSSSATTYSYNFDSKDPGLYKVEVQVGNQTATAYYMNKVLARVSQFSVAEPAVLIYNAVENATQYYITVDCGNDSHNHTEISNGSYTSFNFSNCEMQEGGIVFTVTATAPGWASSVSETFVYNRDLDEVSELYYNDATAEISWDSVANASYYNVEVTNGGTTTKYVVGDEKKFSLQSFTGETTVKVTPFARGYNLPAAAEMTQNLVRLVTPTGVKQYVGTAGEKIEWNAVEGADSYKVKLGASVYEATGTSFSVPSELSKEGSVYEVSIMAVGKTEDENSLWSTPVYAYYQQINSVTYDKGVVSWNLVGGAYDCVVKVNGTIAKTITDGSNSAKVVLTKKGVNKIEVAVRSFIFEELSTVSIDVYAHEVNFDVQGGGAVETIYVATGDPIELPTTTREHRIFSGWYNVPGGASDNGSEYIDPIYTASNSMTLYAYWTAEPQDVNLTINAGEGSFVEGSEVIEQMQTVYYGESYKLPVPTSSDLGKTFKGWYDKDGNQLTDYKGNSVAPWEGAKDGVLEAQFIEILKFTLLEDGTGYRVAKTDALNYVEELKIPAYLPNPADPTKTLPVVEIAPNAFYYCDNLKKISIPDTVQDINIGAGGPTATASAFQFCNNLKEIEVYCSDEANHATHEVKFASVDGVLMRVVSNEDDTEYKYEMYFIPAGMSGDYVVPNSVVSIPSNVFNKAKFNKVTISASVTSIGNNAFAGSKINEIVFEDPTADDASVALDLGTKAFANNVLLQKVTLPARKLTFSGNTSFNQDIFSNCPMLSELNMAETSNYKTVDGLLCKFIGNNLQIVFCPAGFSGDENGVYEIPVSVSSIGAGAFADCRKIKGIVINEYIMEISEGAFENCAALESVVFEGTADSTELEIGAEAFKGCVSLTEIELPQNLSLVGESAFAGTKKLTHVYFNCGGDVTFEDDVFNDGTNGYVKTIKLGKGINTIDNFADVFDKCKIEKIEVEAGNTAYYRDAYGVLYNGDATTLLYAPYIAYNDGTDATKYAIPNTVTTIAANAFAGRTELYAIEIPASVTAIGTRAFSACSNLETLTFKARTEDLAIGDYAFNSCTSLTAVDLVSGITSVGNYAFYYCTSLKTFKMSETVETITPSNALNYCNALETITVDPANTKFAAVNNVIYGKDTNGVVKTLYLAANLAGEVEVPKTVTSIAASAFSGKSGVTKVTFLHDGTVNVTFGANAFLNAKSIQEITLPAGTKEITNSMFSGCTALKKITIPGSVELIENLAFANCSSLTDLNFLPGTASLVIEDARSSEVALSWQNSPFNGCTALETVVFPERTKKIGAYAFYQSNLKKVVIPSTVEILGTLRTLSNGASNFQSSSVFSMCEKLEEVIFAVNSPEYNPNGTLVSKLTHIGGQAFNGCKSLKSIDMPDSVVYLGNQPFGSCESMTKAKLSHGITNLATQTHKELGGTNTSTTNLANLFYGCKKLTDVTLPENLKTIGARSFSGCSSLQTIELPDTLTMLGESMFINCSSLTTVELPASVKTINTYAFSSSGLTSITIPKTVTSIGASAFVSCSKLKNVTIEDGGSLAIGNLAFSGCTALESIVLPNSVTSLGTQAFKNCVSLKSATISSKVTTTASNLYMRFDGCSSLETLILDATAKMQVDVESGTVLGISNNTLYFALSGGNNTDGVVDIPEGVTRIEHYAFANLNWVKEVNIPASVTQIGQYVFQGCSNLEKVNFGTKTDGTYGIQTIEQYAFENSGLKEITVPASVTTVGNYAFRNSSKLRTATWNSKAAIPQSAFQNSPLLETVTITGNVTSVGNSAFGSCSKLKGISLPDSVTTLGTGVFSSCSSLETVKLSAKLTSIPNQTFMSCTSLKSFTIPSKVTSIGNSAFSSCSALTEIIIPEGVTSIGNANQSSTFQYCKSLKSVHLPNSLTTVGPYAFGNCTALETVTGGASVQGIYDNAFTGCTALKEANFPKATTLHSNMFAGCTALEVVYMPQVNAVHYTGNASNPNYNSDSFKGCTSLHTVTFGALDVIPKNTFKDCVSLVNFTLPATVTKIYENAFENAALTSITLPDGLTTVGKMAFYGNKFTTVNIPATLSSIGAGAFANCQNIMEFTVDSNNSWYKTDANLVETNKAFVGSLFNVEGDLLYFPAAKTVEGGIFDLSEYDVTFGEYAFAGAKGLKAIKLPETMTTIPAYAFAESGILAIEIKSHITSIGDHAFYNCKDLVNLSMTDSITSIGNYAFYGCESLKTVTLPGEITKISNYAFANSGLTSIAIPESVTQIADGAFSNTHLTSITIPSNVTTIGPRAFYNNMYLTEIILPETAIKVAGYAFANTAVEELVIYEGFEVQGDMGGTGSVGDAIEGDYAFAYNLQLKEVTFMGEATLQKFAFKGCTALEKVTFAGEWGDSIPYGTFEDCTSLKEIVLPDTVKTIKAAAFKNCTSLTSLVIPASVTSIEYKTDYGYAFEGWTSEQTIYVSVSEEEAIAMYGAGWSGGATVVYAESNSGSDSESNSGSDSESNSGSDSESNSGSDSESNSGSDSESNSGSASESNPGSGSASGSIAGRA